MKIFSSCRWRANKWSKAYLWLILKFILYSWVADKNQKKKVIGGLKSGFHSSFVDGGNRVFNILGQLKKSLGIPGLKWSHLKEFYY